MYSARVKTAAIQATILLSAAVVAVLSRGLDLNAVASSNSTDNCTEEDYAVFSAGLDYLYGKKLNSVLLIDHTSTGVPPGAVAIINLRGTIQSFYDRIPEESRRDFDFRNKNRANVESNKLKTSIEVSSMKDQDGQAFTASGGWKTFYKEHPQNHHILVVSLPGINRAHDRALLYVGHTCGPMCGGGTVLLFTKEAGRWVVVDTETLWQT